MRTATGKRPILRRERGVVLLVVLVVAGIFAVLAYAALAVSINSLESTDTYRHTFVARQVAEGAVHEAAYGLLVDPDRLDPTYLDPSYALSTSESSLRTTLIETGGSAAMELDSFPSTIERSAYTLGSGVSTYYPDTDVIAGDRVEATYRYLDDYTFSEDYPSYEFAQVQTTGDLVVYGVGEVNEPDGDMTLFSFVRGDYPSVQWNYDVRETGVTEPSRIGPYPYIETEHPYGTDRSRDWSVTYMEDPRHRGRNIYGIRLMAKVDHVQIDAGDWLYVSKWKWDETPPSFQGLGEIPWYHRLGGPAPYTNPEEVFSQLLDTTTIGLFFVSDAVPPPPGMDYGFRVSGVRYNFDYDEFAAYYETPHPYDLNIGPINPTDHNVQVIYSPYQAGSGPLPVVEQMTIQFDDRFSLDPGDLLYLFNASEETPLTPVMTYTSAIPPPPGGYAPVIDRVNPALPLGYILILQRDGPGDSDGVADYGYKVTGMEYTDAQSDWVRVEKPVVETPHNLYLGANDTLYSLPIPIMPPMNLVGYQTIYRPACPNTDDDVTGLGTVSNWYVRFSPSCDLTATTPNANDDYIRITTPGNILITDPTGMGASDTMFFVHPESNPGQMFLGVDYRFLPVSDLKDREVDCGTADLLEIEFLSDTTDEYEASMENIGYRVSWVAYDTPDGADDDRSPPTIRSDVNFPRNTSYPAFGSGPRERSEWWFADDSNDALVVGLHFDRYEFDLDPGDRIEVYDKDGILIATILSTSVEGGPSAGGPINPDIPGGGSQPGGGPGAGGPDILDGPAAGTLVDLNATYGWVLVPGTTAQVVLIGDGDDNEGHSGFEIDRCAYVNGDLTEIRDYLTEYTDVAYDQYYDRSADEVMRAFRTLGMD